MKKILYLVFLFFTLSSSVLASELSTRIIPDTYAYYYDDNLLRDRYFEASIYSFDSRVAYCIELGKKITTSNYESYNNFDNLDIDNSIKEKIKLISYYGYDYPGHNTDLYYLAAQELIWKEISGISVKWVKYFNPNVIIDTSREKNEIINLVSSHNLLPSFMNDKLIVKSGEENVYVDNNNVLSFYNSMSNGVTIKENTLVIDANFTGNKIELKRKSYTDRVFLLYSSGSSQKMVSSGVLENIENIDVIFRGSIEIFKYGEDIVYENDGFNYINILLGNVIFELYASEDIYENNRIIYKKDELIKKVETDKQGYAIINDLPFGNYYLQEVKSNMGNAINDEKKLISISDLDRRIKIEVNNYLPKGKLIINKKDSITGEALSGTLFEIYTIDDKLIYSGYTDFEGKLVIDDLYYQDYYISEVSASLGYKVLSERIYFSIDEELTSIDIENDRVDVPSTLISMYDIRSSILLLFLIVGIFIYGKKKAL